MRGERRKDYWSHFFLNNLEGVGEFNFPDYQKLISNICGSIKESKNI